MRLRRYCVTVLDNWEPLRVFWTHRAAMRWRNRIGDHAHLYVWRGGGWWHQAAGGDESARVKEE